jgi:hypothetical protein
VLGGNQFRKPVGLGRIIVIDEGNEIGLTRERLAQGPIARKRDAAFRLRHIVQLR